MLIGIFESLCVFYFLSVSQMKSPMSNGEHSETSLTAKLPLRNELAKFRNSRELDGGNGQGKTGTSALPTQE